MQANFWHNKWKSNDIGFHLADANPLLVKHFNSLELVSGNRLFLPLCGKTRDIAWLLTSGFAIAGAELSRLAVEQLFSDLNIVPQISISGNCERYSAENIDIFVGDIFALSATELGKIDGIYDRAALVALPETMRAQYTAHLLEITARAPQLLICFDYDQSLLEGPPFAISDAEVNSHYASSYTLKLLEAAECLGGLKATCPAQEKVWLLNHS